MSLFEKRTQLKPLEYPELLEFVDAIRHSYWIHTEFKYTSDIQDYHVNTTPKEKEAIKRAMLAISQVEVAVKNFWGNLYKRMPKPEIGSVGATFAESEVRHQDAYSHLLEQLGLNEEFDKLSENKAIKGRVDYLESIVDQSASEDDKDFAMSLLLFSLFVEHVSLFSQFLTILSFNKHKDMFKGMSNAVEATSKEEQIHGLFGVEIINILQKEHPEWFDEDWKNHVFEKCKEVYGEEEKIIDWIFEAGDLEFLSKEDVKMFVKDRLNKSLVYVGIDKPYGTDNTTLERTEWFDNEVIATKHTDFFNKRSINYNKRSSSVTGADLF